MQHKTGGTVTVVSETSPQKAQDAAVSTHTTAAGGSEGKTVVLKRRRKWIDKARVETRLEELRLEQERERQALKSKQKGSEGKEEGSAEKQEKGEDRRVRWEEGVIDNEFLNKKSSKVCCQFHRSRPFDETSSESEASDWEGFKHQYVPGNEGNATHGTASDATKPKDTGSQHRQ